MTFSACVERVSGALERRQSGHLALIHPDGSAPKDIVETLVERLLRGESGGGGRQAEIVRGSVESAGSFRVVRRGLRTGSVPGR